MVSHFLRSLPIPYRSDTVYVFLVDPMRAPRLKGAINAFINYLRSAGVKSDIIALVISSRRRAAVKYLERRNFTADYNLVVDNGYQEFLNSFIFNRGYLGAPFVAKFSVKAGQLLSSYSLGGVTDSASVVWFIKDISKPTGKRPASERQPKIKIKADAFRIRCARKQRLLSDNEHPVSIANFLSVNPSGSYVAFNDKLTNHIYIFDLTTGRLINVVSPDSSEETLFSAWMPGHVYRFMKQSDMTLYLGNTFLDDTTLLITASLPKVVQIIWEGDSDFGFFNIPVFIKKGIFSNRLLNCKLIQSLPDSVPGGISHVMPSFLPQAGLIFLPYSRGWPRGNQTLTDKITPEENPFANEFYEQPLPLFAAYRPSGEFVNFWGRLSDRVLQLRLGYYRRFPKLARFQNGRFYLIDGCSVKIFIYNQETLLIDSIKLFDDLPLFYPNVDRLKEPELYLAEAFKLNFRAEIKDFLVTPGCCYALVLWDRRQPILYKVGLFDNTVRRYSLPARYEGKEASYYLLRESPDGVSAVALLESLDETCYCEFKLP
ncbi:MAG: hypothetical protein ACUVUR_06545 [bacterium]